MSYKISFRIDDRVAQTVVPDDVKVLSVDKLISPKSAKELTVLINLKNGENTVQNNMVLPCEVEHIDDTAETDLANPCILGAVDKIPEAMLIVFVNATNEQDTPETKNTRLYFAVLKECNDD